MGIKRKKLRVSIRLARGRQLTGTQNRRESVIGRTTRLLSFTTGASSRLPVADLVTLASNLFLTYNAETHRETMSDATTAPACKSVIVGNIDIYLSPSADNEKWHKSFSGSFYYTAR